MQAPFGTGTAFGGATPGQSPPPPQQAPQSKPPTRSVPAPSKPPAEQALREVPKPQPQLAGEAEAAATVEADFLACLYETRKLEAEVHAAVTQAVAEVRDGCWEQNWPALGSIPRCQAACTAP